MKIDVLVIGELLADLISDEYVNTLSAAKTFHLFQGGSPSNFCANLKWLGNETELVACVGNDSIGNFLTQSLLNIGLSGSYINKNNSLPSSIVLVGKSQASPDFIAYRLADAQIAEVDSSLIANSTIIHTSAFALSLNPARTSILNAMRVASKAGKLVSVDWNFAPQIWHNNTGIGVFEELCTMNLLLKLSLDDFMRFSGNYKASAEDAMRFLDNYTTNATCLTCGSNGVFYKSSGTNWQKAEAQKITVKDTTGAGDAFWAGFISAFLSNSNLNECVEKGIQIASQKIQKLGPLYCK
ncbi:MAG: carbohydrate kinase [Bacteroidetes bacterium B1(2017)]|nr:MAG: carbohydrate kinase [Bacteroidetes bacterium B1(2017)]